MATRLGVIAVRGDAVGALVKPFPELEKASPAVGNGWAWASFSLWHHSALVGATADRRLARLKQPGLQVWTEDDAVWYLALHRPGAPPLRYVQWLRYLSSSRRKGTLEALIREHEDDLAPGWGWLGPRPKGPVSGLRAFCRVRAGLVCDALVEAKVSHDRKTVVRALAGDSITRDEREAGVGNLPRFLEAIGLDEIFEDDDDELEVEDEAEVEREELDLPAMLLAASGEAKPAQLDRPVVARASALWLLPWACNTDVMIMFVVTPARSTKLAWPKLEHLVVADRGGATMVCFPWQSVWATARYIAGLERVFATLPGGSTLEMIAAEVSEDDDDDDAPSTAGNVRFRGTVSKDGWTITHALPAVKAAPLERAIEIFAWVTGKGPLRAVDDAEAAAILALAASSGHFMEDQPSAKACALTIAAEYRPHLAMIAFRHRFADGPWDAITS